MTKYSRIVQFRVTDFQWLELHRRIPAGQLPQILRKFIESYLQTPDKKPELKQVEIDIEKTRLKMKELGKTLTNLEAVKLSIEQETEEETARKKAEFEKYLKKGKQYKESLDAAGDLLDIEL